MTTNFFAGVTVNHKARSRILSLPPANKDVVIFFTPRSGSSWLTDILPQTNRFGRANEIFNPNFLPSMARALQAETLNDYIEAARRRFNLGDVFSFEITMHQLNAVFDSHDDFKRQFGDAQYVWLIRKDIIAQAVSLAKMVNKNISHSTQIANREIEAADRSFDYSEKEFSKWIKHIRNAEVQTETFFSINKIQPIRLSYESMIDSGAKKVAYTLLDHLEIPLPQEFSFQEGHSKIGTSLNANYTERFKKEKMFLTKRLDLQRRQLLYKLQDL